MYLIRKMHPQLKRKIRSGLDAIVHNPEIGKDLKLELAGLKTYRVGRMRIIYRLDCHCIVELVAVGPRKNIYEETYRLISESPPAEPVAS